MLAWIKQLFSSQPKSEGQWIAEVAIAGLQHYRGNDLAEMVNEGDMVTLLPEPQNAHDPNAIVVMWHNNKIGYIPAALSRDIRRQMQNGVEIIAMIVDVKPVRFGRKWIKIRLTAEKN